MKHAGIVGKRLALAALLTVAAQPSRAAAGTRLLVAVTEPDIDAIVAVVGGGTVDTFSMFKGCIARKNLQVEPEVRERLANADAVVWTGYLNEAAAIHGSLPGHSAGTKPGARTTTWIDVSKGAIRANVPTSACFGYVDAGEMAGDPFFWLNPRNGSVIARNLAHGLGRLRPENRSLYLANADKFEASLKKDIERWTAELKPLAGLRVFSSQCGWQNFARLGGPSFVVCKGTPGTLPSPQLLLEHVRQVRAELIMVDPNTPQEYGEAFRARSGVKVIEVASSIEHLHGAKSYSALFDNIIQVMLRSGVEPTHRRN